jgi:thiol-disulfide isomerase/thioredoxin
LELLENELNSRLERKLALLNQPKNGEAYVDFTYPNTKGEEVSLSSFMGRMVYVDVWATWCGPCKAEIPSLQTLEHDYSGKDVVFLSVSVDRVKEDWLEMVKEKELGGVQLWADGWSQITKDYAIFGIPRFMLFSADGKVISNDAPRPSDPEIRVLFDAHLTE